MGEIVFAHGVGGLKATVHALALETVALENNIKVRFRTGASGGAIAAAVASHSAVRAKGFDWAVKRISEIDEDKLYDEDYTQQVLDRIRNKWLRLPRRKGDTPLLGWYRGNGLLFALRDLVADLGTVVSPFGLVTCTLEPSALTNLNVAPLVALNAAAGLGQKKVRWYGANSTTSKDVTGLVDAVRASISIPFVLRPHEIDGHHEVDGGVLSLTTEEVAADELRRTFDGPPKNGEARKIALVISDMQSLPDVQDGLADDVFELGIMLVRAVGTHLQGLNTRYTVNTLQPLEIGLWRITPPDKLKTKCRQFETKAAPALFEEYCQSLRSDTRFDSLVQWVNS